MLGGFEKDTEGMGPLYEPMRRKVAEIINATWDMAYSSARIATLQEVTGKQSTHLFEEGVKTGYRSALEAAKGVVDDLKCKEGCENDMDRGHDGWREGIADTSRAIDSLHNNYKKDE